MFFCFSQNLPNSFIKYSFDFFQPFKNAKAVRSSYQTIQKQEARYVAHRSQFTNVCSLNVFFFVNMKKNPTLQ